MSVKVKMHIYYVSKTIFYGDIKLPIDVYDSICSTSKNKILKNKNFRQLNCHVNDGILKAN